MITIVGGVYRERCMRPAWDDIYGSAGRAATAIARFGGQAELHACVDSDTQIVVDARAAAEGFQFNATPAQAPVTFEYIHGLANPDIRRGTHVKSKLQVSAEKVLRFGMIDGTAVVDAEYAVFDPQNADGTESFRANGSEAKHLALVLNRHEANLLVPSSSGLTAQELAIVLAEQERAEVVVIKMGPLGALVYDNGAISTVPAYRTERVWKIGSGDTFAAHFALGWMDKDLSAHDAASVASIATAFYCENQASPTRLYLLASNRTHCNRQFGIAMVTPLRCTSQGHSSPSQSFGWSGRLAETCWQWGWMYFPHTMTSVLALLRTWSKRTSKGCVIATFSLRLVMGSTRARFTRLATLGR